MRPSGLASPKSEPASNRTSPWASLFAHGESVLDLARAPNGDQPLRYYRRQKLRLIFGAAELNSRCYGRIAREFSTREYRVRLVPRVHAPWQYAARDFRGPRTRRVPRC